MAADKKQGVAIPSTHTTPQGAPSVLDTLQGTGGVPYTPPQPAAYTPPQPPGYAAPPPANPTGYGQQPPPAPPKPARAPARVPIRVQVPKELANRVRGAVAALSYQVDGWTSLNAATAAALEAFVTAAEQQYNHGQHFPWDPERQLQPGRKLGT